MVESFKKRISRRFIFGLVLAAAVMALVMAVAPTGGPSSGVLGAYTNSGSATGDGTPINAQGNWFMYNVYSGAGPATYNIQAGNPVGGTNYIGTYMVTPNGDGTYSVTYNINSGVTVIDQQLAISSSPNFTGKPGQDANQPNVQTFTAPGGGPIYIFAHFSIAY